MSDVMKRRRAAGANSSGAGNAPAAKRRGRRVLPRLSDAQREHIIRRLAAGDFPSAIQRDVHARFGVAVSRDAIAYYDPTRVRTPKKRWAPLFHAARTARAVQQAELAGTARQIERLARRIVEVLERRVPAGFDVARARAITAEDRLRALKGFVAKLAVTDPAALAQVARALDTAPQSAPCAPCEACRAP